MNTFRNFIESVEITPEAIKYWSNYLGGRRFGSEKEARDEIFRLKQKADSEFGHVFKMDGPEYNRAFADAMPIWKSGNSYKVGKRITVDRRLRRSELKVVRPGIEELNMVAQSNGESDYEFHLEIAWLPIKDLISNDDVYAVQPNEIQKIRNLASEIKQNKWIEAIIYHYNEGWVIEGQHRTRAMQVLGFNTVPGVGIEYL